MWARGFMNKRVLIVCRNVGFEGTSQGFWSLKLDFADKTALDTALRSLGKGLTNPLEQSVILANESGDQVGFNPHLYAYHRVDNVDGWEDADWTQLPVDGASAPDRENPEP